MSANVKFTCLNCRVGFPTAEAQRVHYKTEWHRYNLKRKVAGMAPLTADAFRARVTQQRQEAEDNAAQAKADYECTPCRKSFRSKNALESHLQSKKHLQMIMPSSTSSERTPEAAEAGAPTDASITPARPTPMATAAAASTTSIPDAHRQPIAEQNRKYDELARRWEEKLAQEKLPEFVEEPVLEPQDCIFDTYRADSFEANIEYMSSRHGFFIPNVEFVVDLEGLVRYLQLKAGNYFTCLYCNKQLADLEGVRKHMEDKGHKMIDYSEEGQLELGDFYDFSSTYPDDSNLTDAERDADLTLAVHQHQGQLHRDGFDLVLPSGRRAGHRELNRYYKQHFKARDERDSVRIGRIVAQYRALGHKGVELPSEKVRRDQAYGIRWQRDKRLEIGMKHNSLQFHYREQVLQ
ncbi:uncharacterized protein MONBRDRAFT_17002 [Monosiga brevicollis MX1]|uniref:C2H2-type domain-containing protein n=1 Tax=Monosiga brevicollis TaxID=81824 RepID=A9UNU5_MONBE|nr:uncharacterized protein MONBRDRAFT_17002 [Monosiga brevicollis MX1]EDQ92761.1 predicted protein [Monosiga brevicollis MX1]|eukprot:XP_001742523.1 hypothetical protein [Monosiga brevicollis MX1]